MNWDNVLDELLNLFYQAIRDAISGITLPTGDTLIPTLVYSALITVVSALSTALWDIAFFDWRGALLATILFLGLVLIERKGYYEVSRLYRTVRVGIAVIEERAKGSGARFQAHRSTNADRGVSEASSGKPDARGSV